MDFLKLFFRYIPPYIGRLVLNISILIISAIFSVFSFAAIIPVLRILFGLSDMRIQYIDFGGNELSLIETFKNNILFFLQQQVDTNGHEKALLLIVLFAFATTALANVTSYLGDFVRIPVRTGVLRDIRRDLYQKIVGMPISFLSYDKQKGDIISRITSDASEVEYSIGSMLDILIKNPVKIVVYLTTLFSISCRLSVYALLLLTVCVIILAAIGYSLKKFAMRSQILRGKILSHFDETIENLLIIKLFTSENKMSKRFKEVNESTRKAFNRMNRQYAFVFPTSNFTVTTVAIVLLWFGGRMVLAGHSNLDASQFIYFLVVFISIIPCITDISRAAYGIRKAHASVDRINMILNVDTESVDVENYGCKLPEGNLTIEYKDVSFEYENNKPILKDINLQIKTGEKTAIVGHTGSGKSTLVKLLPLLYEPSSGIIRIGGNDIQSLPITALRKMISFVSQETLLFNDTISYNISFGINNASKQDIENAAKAAGIHDFIMSMKDGYDTIIGDNGASLSGGQRQGLSIARALLKDSPILILDEATSALDGDSERQLCESISKLMKGKTTIIVSHRISTVKNADRIYVLDQGSIVESGTHDELVAKGSFYNNLFK